MNKKAKILSRPLMKQTFKANLALVTVILIVMILIANVINFASSIMATDTKEGISDSSKESLFSYMFVMASFNELSGSDLSYDDFINSPDKEKYQNAFDMYNASKEDEADEMSVSELERLVTQVESSDTDAKTYVEQFEYVYALSGKEGCFTGEELNAEGFLTTTLETAGMVKEDLEKMQDLDFTTYFTKIYFTVIGILPVFVLVIIVANSLIASQVDKGSMAYILSTPTKRSTVAITQATYLILIPLVLLIITCITRCISTVILFDEVNVPKLAMLYFGMYLIVEAAGGICYACSCFFNQSSKALAIGGGITLWFFLAALLGMFGSKDMIDMGIGVDVLSIFNKLTIVSLFDADAVQTIGASSVDWGFVPGMIALAFVAIAGYVIGGVKFCKKDLPL